MHWIDPNSLPKKMGTVERFVMNPKGDLDGLLFSDGTLVHFPPHLSAPVAASIRIGDQVAVYGVRPRDAELVAAISLVTAKGETILDRGPDHDRKKASALHRTKLEARGTVRRSLYGPKGELRGALLDDGTVLRVAPHEAERVRNYLQSGTAIDARGEGIESEQGRAIEVREIGSPGGTPTTLAGKPKHDQAHDGKHKPPKAGHGHKHGKPSHEHPASEVAAHAPAVTHQGRTP